MLIFTSWLQYSTTVGASWSALLVEAGREGVTSFSFPLTSNQEDSGEDLPANHDEPQPDARRRRQTADFLGAG